MDYGSWNYWEQRYQRQRSGDVLDDLLNNSLFDGTTLRSSLHTASLKRDPVVQDSLPKIHDPTCDWLCTFAEIRSLLPAHLFSEVSRDKTVVDVGCGTSHFLSDLRRAGCEGRLIGVDFSKTAIDICRREFRKRRIEYACADVCELRNVLPEPNTADLVLDKGTLNALRCEQDVRTRNRNVWRMCAEVGRIVAADGLFVWINLCDIQSDGGVNVCVDHVLPALIDGSAAAWRVEWHTRKLPKACQSRSRFTAQELRALLCVAEPEATHDACTEHVMMPDVIIFRRLPDQAVRDSSATWENCAERDVGVVDPRRESMCRTNLNGTIISLHPSGPCQQCDNGSPSTDKAAGVGTGHTAE